MKYRIIDYVIVEEEGRLYSVTIGLDHVHP